MANTIPMKQGDLLPKLTATLRVGNPLQPVDLTGCTVKLRYALPRLGLLFEKTADVVGTPTEGNVKYEWVAGDTDLPGIYEAEWRVTVPTGKPLTVPNGLDFTLEIVPSVGSLRWAAGDSAAQTARLLRRLRGRLADTERLIYTEDAALVQALYDTFEDAMAELVLPTVLFQATDPSYAAGDPLNTDKTLTRWQQDVWMLFTAREVLEAEVLAAARVAGTVETPAGRISMRDLAATMRSALDDVESDLDTKLERGGGFLNFVDVSKSTTARFLQD